MAKLFQFKVSPYLALLSLSSVAVIGCGDLPDETPGTTTGTTASGGASSTGSGGASSTTGSGGSSTTGSTTGMTSQCGSGDMPFQVVATAETNMTLTSDLQITETPVIPNSLDITFEWSGVTKDFFGHPWDPASIVQVALVPWTVDLATVEHGINVDDPELQSYNEIPVFFDPMAAGTPATSAKITDFKDAGGAPVAEETFLSYLDPSKNYTFTVLLQAEKAVGTGVRMIQAFKPTDGATTTTVTFSDTSSTLSATATFGAPISVPAGQASLLFDWGQLDTRSFGGQFTSQLFDIIVGKYDPSADLAAGILDIDYNYQNFWRGQAPGTGTALDLSTLKDESGAAFPGIDASSQYLVGMVCPACTNPSPWYLAHLTPCP